MQNSSDSQRSKSIITDPFVLIGSAISAFGLIGIVDTLLSWRAFFQNFFEYWISFRDTIFSILPFHVPSDLKDIIIINASVASVILRSSYILRSTKIDESKDLNSITFALLSILLIYSLIFFPVIIPIREYIIQFIDYIITDYAPEFLLVTLRVAVEVFFLGPFGYTIFFLIEAIRDGLRWDADPDARTTAVVLLSNSMLVFAFVAAIIVLFARW